MIFLNYAEKLCDAERGGRMKDCPICERIEDVKMIGSNINSITFRVALIEDSRSI